LAKGVQTGEKEDYAGQIGIIAAVCLGAGKPHKDERPLERGAPVHSGAGETPVLPGTTRYHALQLETIETMPARSTLPRQEVSWAEKGPGTLAAVPLPTRH
jgi:hypothetical protein